MDPAEISLNPSKRPCLNSRLQSGESVKSRSVGPRQRERPRLTRGGEPRVQLQGCRGVVQEGEGGVWGAGVVGQQGEFIRQLIIRAMWLKVDEEGEADEG